MKPIEEWQRIEFSKTMADVECLRIIAILARQTASLTEIADRLHVPDEDAQKYLAFLQQNGVITLYDNQYELVDPVIIPSTRKHPFNALNEYLPIPILDLKSLGALTVYLNPDATLRQIPSAPAKLGLVLNYLVAAFTPRADYTEKEVNTVLRRFHLDVAGLRRDLIMSGLMERESDGSRSGEPANKD